MSLENDLRRDPEATGLPVKFANGEEFLVPLCPTKPLFEKKDGHWVLVGEEYTEPLAGHLEYFRQLWKDKPANVAALEGEEAEKYVRHSGALQAEALSLNYEVGAEHLKELCDPTDAALTAVVLYALRIGKLTEKPGDAEEKKTVPPSSSG